jgi:hypothetical protein
VNIYAQYSNHPTVNLPSASAYLPNRDRERIDVTPVGPYSDIEVKLWSHVPGFDRASVIDREYTLLVANRTVPLSPPMMAAVVCLFRTDTSPKSASRARCSRSTKMLT